MNGRSRLERGVILLISGLMCTLWVSPATAESDIHLAPSLVAQRDQDKCQPWQRRDKDGDCVDNPGTVHHGGNYVPGPGQQCWVECLCREGQYPSGSSCSPCSFVGMV